MKQRILGRFVSLRASLLEDEQRKRMQFVSVSAILSAISILMTLVNLFTQRYALMLSTLLFAILNIADLALSLRSKKGRQLASVLFSLELTALFVYFVVSGEPEGFSAIWVCMVPASGLLLFGKHHGSVLCAAELAILLFFFYLPFGRSLLQYRYTDTFLLRFPMLYLAFFAVAYFLEALRSATYDALLESRRRYQHLYSHDALTNVYNRYGFNEHMDAVLMAPHERGVALMILDIDHFKDLNDRYGHPFGDVVLKEIAALITQRSGENAAVCRWGGEEFAVIFSDATHSGAVAESILCGIRELSMSNGAERVRVTVSAGMVVAPSSLPIDPAALVTQTDRCLYRAKEEGRDRLVSATYQAA